MTRRVIYTRADVAATLIRRALRLAGLSTLCPWRRSPMPKRRGGQRVDNPLDDLGDGERSFMTTAVPGSVRFGRRTP